MEEFWELAGYTHFKNLLRAEEAGVFIHQLLLVTRAELPPLGWGVTPWHIQPVPCEDKQAQEARECSGKIVGTGSLKSSMSAWK
jgi:hypothetical protein